jgi:hypothetical protein
MITVLSLLDGAWTRSTRNDAGKLGQDPELVAHLDRVYQRTWALVARARPDVFSKTATATLANIPPTLTLPAALLELTHVATSAGADVAVIPAHERARTWHLAPAVYRIGATLVSRNQAGDPRTNDVLTLTYLDAPATLASVAGSLDARWPARHAQYLVDALAVYLSTKDAGREAGEHQKLLGDAQASAAALAAEFGLPPAAVEWMHAPRERAAPSEAAT